jgi:hypothetical protein
LGEIQILISYFESFLYNITVIDGSVSYYFLHAIEIVFLSYFESHVVVVVVHVLVDLIFDHYLIIFVACVQKDAGFVSAVGFAQKIFAVLDRAKQNPQPAA